ncbi:MAG: hypothetical protein QOD28_1521 [Acidobacteriota bacterium]|nr:hypothetical protein [Acidobacteriota bacterium]
MKNYLCYWKHSTAARNIGFPLDHAASGQFGKIEPGDVLWVVTYEHGKLYLLGRLDVARVVSQSEAERILKEKLWKAKFHVIAKTNTVATVVSIDLMEVAPVLRFESDIDRLPPNFTAQSVRRLRLLTAESIEIFEDLWNVTVLMQSDKAEHLGGGWVGNSATKLRSAGQGFAVSPEVRRAIEIYAMQRAIEFFKGKGYDVEDTSMNNPFDLFCIKGTDELFVEVKGTQTRGETVILTKNEVGFARKNRERMALFILHSVLITSEHGIQISDGEFNIFHPWDVDQGTLIATQYLYTPNE